MTTAIALSGGGSRGAFEVGALRYLYDQGIRPDIICGTSVGSINAAKLAEGEGDPTQGLAGLEAIWRQLQGPSDMYAEEPWLGQIDPRFRRWLLFGGGLPVDAPPEVHSGDWGIYDPFNRKFASFAQIGWLFDDGVKVLEALKQFLGARALLNLDPIYRKMIGEPATGLAKQLDPGKVQAWSAAGRKLRLAVVALESGQLRYVTETGQLLERDNQTPTRRRELPPECRQIAAQIAADQRKRQRLQQALSTAAPGEKPDLLDQIDELNAQLARETEAYARCRERTVFGTAVEVPLPLGVLASASIPGLFPTVVMGDETYVDSGVREILPLQAAVDLGADTVYCLVASGSLKRADRSYADSPGYEALARSLVDITLEEILHGDMKAVSTGPQPTIHFVQPTFDLYDMTTIDPGLISINMAYGYMRAADVLGGLTPNDRCWQLTDDIIRARRRIWTLENLQAGQPLAPADHGSYPSPDAGRRRLEKLEELQALVAERRQSGCALPFDVDAWSHGPERHPWASSNRATFMQQSEAPSVAERSQGFGVTILMRNTGATTWTPPTYKLGAQNPPDNNTWGFNRVDLPGPVQPGQDITLQLRATAPARAGTYNFQWRMVQEAVEWFGDATPNVVVNVPEPPECATIRDEISQKQAEIKSQEERKRHLNFKNEADREKIDAINEHIAELSSEIRTAQQQQAQLGCL